MASIARNITIRLERGQEGYKLIFKFAGIPTPIQSLPITEKYLLDIKTRFSELLHDLRSMWWRDDILNQSFKKLSKSIEKIHKFTINFLVDVFGATEMRRLFNQINKAREEMWELIHWEEPLGIIEYEGNLDEFIPLDYLLFQHGNIKDSPKNLHEFVLAFSQMLGFSYIIQRNTSKKDLKESKNNVIEKLEKQVHFEDKLDLDMYVCNNLIHVPKEIDFFAKENSDHFDTKIKSPGTYGDNSEEELVDALLVNKNSNFHHFSCHCNSTNNDAWKHYLTFGKNKIVLEDLRYQYLKKNIEEQIKFNETIAFLNACGGAVINPLGKTSFPAVFLDFLGHAGFIGPEYRIPDAFACEFARIFYAILLRFGHFGLALFKTRWFFLKKFNNPLGIFYTLYSDCNLRLSKTFDSVNI